MKICFFTENYYKGGLDTFIINLINAWPNSKDKLTLYCNGTHPGLDTIVEETASRIAIRKYYRLFTSTIAQGQSKLNWAQYYPICTFFKLTYRVLEYPILFPWYVLTLMIFFRRSKFDRLMVINGGYPASLLGRCAVIAWRLAGKKSQAVMNFHNSTSSASWYNSFFENMIDKWVIKSTSHIVSVSKDCLSSLNCRNAFTDSRNLSFIYNGIGDSAKSLKNAEAKREDGSLHKRYCLMLATYETRKGHFYLLQAFQSVVKSFPDVQLQIYGHGTPAEKKQVADEVFRLNLEEHVILADFTRQTAALLAGASVLVVPSQSYESFGLTIIEAMAFGVPVVTTDVGGMPEVMADSNAGYVCSKDDPLEFSGAIIKILGDQALGSELGRNGRKVFESRFMASTMAKSYSKLLE